MRTIMKRWFLSSLLFSAVLSAAWPACAATLYFPHVDTSLPWQTEIAVVNTGGQPVTGLMRGFSNDGQLVSTLAVTLPVHGRRQIIVADEFANHTNIGYIIFETAVASGAPDGNGVGASTVQGYTKFYQAGIYRAAIPAVTEVNTGNIYISHIDSSAQWWTGVSLLNTTATTKVLTITFNDGQVVTYTLNPNQHRVFTIGSLLNQPLQPAIRSAVISNAGGVIGVELFGSNAGMGGNQMEGILLTDKTATVLYYPHVAVDSYWTGIVAYNPSDAACTITITPYNSSGTALTATAIIIAGKAKYVGTVAQLGLPTATAWFRLDSTSPLTGFELFGTTSGNQLAAYAGMGDTGAKAGIFPKIEKNGGWTGIVVVNTEAVAASVVFTAYTDDGTVVDTRVITVGGHAKAVNLAEALFFRDVSSATYIACSADRNIVGLQINGSADNMLLDGLHALAGTPDAAVPATYSIMGTVSGDVVSGILVTLTGAGGTASVLAGTCGEGIYSFTGLGNGTYTVTPSMTGYTFNPASATVTVNGANVTVPPFVATAAMTTYSQADLTGTWNMQMLQGGGRNAWTRFTVAVDSSGLVTFSSVLDSTGSTNRPEANSLQWTINANGVIAESGANARNNVHMTMTSSKNFVAGTGTNSHGDILLWIMQKAVPGTVYQNADLQNKSFVYHQLEVGSTYGWRYGAGTLDSGGAITMTSETLPSGTQMPGATGSAFSVNADGIVTMSGAANASFGGFLSNDKKTIVSTSTDSGSYRLNITQITGQTYTAGPLPSGVSAAHIFAGGTTSPAPFWAHWTFTVASAGVMTVSDFVSSSMSVAAPTTTYTGSIYASGTVTIAELPTYHGQMSHDKKFSVGTRTISPGIYSLHVHTK
jgi:hypothetical protein